MLKITKKFYKYILSIILLTLITTISAVYLQFIKGNLLDIAISNIFSNLLTSSLFLLVLIAVELLSYYFLDYFRGKYLVSISTYLRKKFFNSFFNKSTIDIKQNQSGFYIAEYTNKIDVVTKDYYGTMPLLIEIVLKIIFTSISLFLLDYRLAIVTIFLITTPLYIPKIIEKSLKKAQIDNIESFSENISKVTEWFNNFELIKEFNIIKIIKSKFNKSLSKAEDSDFNMKKLSYLAKAISAILSYTSHFIILVLAAILVSREEFSAGQFFIAISIMDQLSYPIISLSVYIQRLVSTKPIADELMESLEQQEDYNTNKHIVINEIKSLDFNQIDFSYGEKKIINKFNLNMKIGEKCLIMGPSGSGKSTLLNLLLSNLEPTNGVIKINNYKVSDIKNLNMILTIRRQDSSILNDTLRNNLCMYSDMNDKDLINILETINLSKFANKKSLDKLIDEDGSNLSGGEKKRISFARTLLRDTQILVFDEPLANIDSVSVGKVENEIINIENKIVFLITHQINEQYIEQFDHVIILNDQPKLII